MNRKWTRSFLAASVVFLAGCGSGSVTGGTPGKLTAAGQPLGDIQLTVFRMGETTPIGGCITQSDGTFELVTPAAQGPLKLEPGEYRVTMESAGAPLRIPKEYSKPDSTPLTINWTEASSAADLSISGELPRQ